MIHKHNNVQKIIQNKKTLRNQVLLKYYNRNQILLKYYITPNHGNYYRQFMMEL